MTQVPTKNQRKGEEKLEEQGEEEEEVNLEK